jgi:hypothetical protein
VSVTGYGVCGLILALQFRKRKAREGEQGSTTFCEQKVAKKLCLVGAGGRRARSNHNAFGGVRLAILLNPFLGLTATRLFLRPDLPPE